LNHPV